MADWVAFVSTVGFGVFVGNGVFVGMDVSVGGGWEGANTVGSVVAVEIGWEKLQAIPISPMVNTKPKK
jgi:hypothetical protein